MREPPIVAEHDADGTPFERPYVYCIQPRCPDCGSDDYQGTKWGVKFDDAKRDSVTCRDCGTKFFILWE